MAFSGVYNPLIQGDAVNSVQGNQSNQHITGEVIHIHGPHMLDRVRTEYDEFEEIKRGHIYKCKEVTTLVGIGTTEVWRDGSYVKPDVQKSVYVAKLYGAQGSTFTVVTYGGQDAQWAWQKDFVRLSQNLYIDAAQLFGLNRSKIPSLIFYDELVPICHFHRKEHFWSSICLAFIRVQKRCRSNEIWFNTKAMCFCVGPEAEGPSLPPFRAATLMKMSSESDLLQDGASFRYLMLHGSQVDRDVLYAASKLRETEESFGWLHSDLDSFRGLYPLGRKHLSLALNSSVSYIKELTSEANDTIQNLRFDTIYSSTNGLIARCSQAFQDIHPYSSYSTCWLDGTFTAAVLVQGHLFSTMLIPITGSQLDTAKNIEICWPINSKVRVMESWLSQSTSILQCLGGSPTLVEEESCVIVKPFELVWRGSVPGFRAPIGVRNVMGGVQTPIDPLSPEVDLAVQRGQDQLQPIYLIVLPPRGVYTMSDLSCWADGKTHYWSYDKDGLSEIPDVECDRMRLPGRLDFQVQLASYTWPKYIYDAMRKWQTARGFDPNTTDFARHLDYQEFEVLQTPSREKNPRKSKRFWQVDEDADFSAFAL